MRKIAYILSFLVLVLTVIPCIDKPKDNILQKSEISQSTNNNNHQSDADHCSPFCTCQCCQSNFFISNFKEANSAVLFEISHNEYSSNLQDLELFDFFIPPKS